ncbi:MAG: potassium channel protein [Deltaproteobacteria bacterium]|nr:potassium channel protein [Deltaproteobacteria bacterium]MBW2111139.1 potassium channel protein [Deltaproteobacteria bacterium]MBW2353082.1 potassium channel protein [Deltaproteobacteria bacterium]HDZ90948.1 potassium channel protein [Deltaproteobacteria bacterium]
MFTTYRRDRTASSLGTRSIIRGFILLALIILVGTGGYMLIEGWSAFEALYMTVITITTVGYGEVRTVSEPGRVFTVFLIFMGMGIMAYTLGIVAQMMVGFQLRAIIGRRKLGLKKRSLRNHYIICGYGRIGNIIAHELEANAIPVIVIDNAPEAGESLEREGIPYIVDDATSEDVLREAGIERAKGLVAVVLSDADNLFLTMTARGLNPDLFILARADEKPTERKLLRAGANKVVLPYLIGGRRMVQTILRPAVTDFIDFTLHGKNIELKMEELPVGERSRLAGVRLADSGVRQEMNVIIVAIRDKDGKMSFNPSSESRIRAGDTLVALGPVSDLEKLARILSG